MAEYVYISAPSKIESFLEKIREVGVPAKATQTWLTSIGFTSTNDRPLIPLMRQIGFIDGSGKPTAAWEEFRKGSRSALVSGIQAGYSAFYSVYPDAHNRSTGELESIVKSTAPRLGKDAVNRVLSTFRTLVKAADFDASSPHNGMRQASAEITIPNGHTPEAATSGQPAAVIRSVGAGVTINVNVQLTLPETTDATVYEKLFGAMREHLLEGLADGS